MAEVRLESIGKVYPNGFRAVSDLSLTISDGELLVLVGPSGCGKSTAMRMIAGLEEITDGTLKIGDKVVNNLRPKERDVAMVFQNYALYPHMSVRENIGFALKVAKVPKTEIAERVSRAASVLELEKLLDSRPANLSGGQRQRVAMGRAIIRNPSIFLLDEPLSNLDAKLRVKMRAEISRIQAELGVTTLYVTHDQVEAMTLGDRVAVIRDGLLQQVDTPQVLYDTPANLFVAGFIGSPPMNLWQAGVTIGETTASVRIGEQSVELEAETVARVPDLAEFSGREVVIGIRPEDLAIGGVDNQEWPALSATVGLVEPLGSEILVHFDPGAPLAATGDPDMEDLSAEGDVLAELAVAKFGPRESFAISEKIELRMDPARLHFFDAEGGNAI